jgi:hypothetical protein
MVEKRVVEVTTKYATTVDSLPRAWLFVMDHLSEVGPDPSISISPVWLLGEGLRDEAREFEVVVEGMVEQPTG